MKAKNHLFGTMLPAVYFGSVAGFLTAIVILIYKLAAKHVIELSAKGYGIIREHLFLVVPVIIALGILSLILATVYKKAPNLKGGGIPTSIIALRGLITFNWLRNLAGIFSLSVLSFFIGVPLGNEGPSVQMGSAVGKGANRLFSRRHRAWNRYSMTGGACAGFSVATGAPISGILFAVEEAHQRISPIIVIVSTVSVLSANVTAELLAPLFNVSTSLFPGLELTALSAEHLPLCALVGAAMGVFAALFLNYYSLINKFFNRLLKKLPHQWKIFTVLTFTVIAGIISIDCISTGHELIISLFEKNFPIITLIIILFVRCTLTLSANTIGITGGIFIPILTVGAVFSAILAGLLQKGFGISDDLYLAIIAMGMAACIASLMKMPITAIAFAIEALGCNKNILHLVILCVTAYVVTELFGAKSINDRVIEDRIAGFSKAHPPKLIDTKVTVEPEAFAIGKEIRDIFWPTGLYVLSVKHAPNRDEETDRLQEGDILHIRYTTCDESLSRTELDAIICTPTKI